MCLSPLVYFGSGGSDLWGANPIEAFNRFLGGWALRLLLVTLTISPLSWINGWIYLLRFRRMLGLFAFTYAVLHLTSYVVLDHFFNWAEIWEDIVKRNFITVGMTTIMLLLPLAVTSNRSMMRRLGNVRWKQVHWLIYPAACLAIIHQYMMIKADFAEPLIQGSLLCVLLLARLIRVARQRGSVSSATGV